MAQKLLVVGLPRWLSSKESACNGGDTGSSLGPEDPLEEGMATHSSILARRIPWTEEPGGLLGRKESDRSVATGQAHRLLVLG